MDELLLHRGDRRLHVGCGMRGANVKKAGDAAHSAHAIRGSDAAQFGRRCAPPIRAIVKRSLHEVNARIIPETRASRGEAHDRSGGIRVRRRMLRCARL